MNARGFTTRMRGRGIGLRASVPPPPHHSLREWSPPAPPPGPHRRCGRSAARAPVARKPYGLTPPKRERGIGRRPVAAGFTLVEMLVALLIFGLLSAAGVGVMAYAADNQGVAGRRMDRLGEFQRARAVLKADLLQAAPRRIRQRNGQPSRNAFTGATDGSPALRNGASPMLALVRRGWDNPDAEPRPSLQYVEYRLVEGRLERSVGAALDGAATGRPQRLLDGVHSARIAYHTRGRWNPGWSGGAEALPDAVRLELELDGLGRIEQLFLLPGQVR